ncbi:hypothetical protein [Legionella spiritensis]|uniref:hypothetical protein n=1 Tax=Legionella spiritensis TaxID=452 RepID=UPI000F8208BC|nr:hypothetical protein [Legionella spiritensis]
MKLFKSPNIVLLLLALVFAAPGLAAYLFYKHPQWLGTKTTNKGTLINPPVLLSTMNSPAKWRLALWLPKDCKSVCRQQLDKLARIRLALGRRLYEVEQWLVMDYPTSPLSEGMMRELRKQDIHVLRLAKSYNKPELLDNHAHVFIVSPDSYLILTYPLTAKSGDIFHDLKRLLNTTDKASG